MTTKWILDKASPTTISTATVPSNTGYLRAVIVVIKAEADDVSITTITSNPAVSIDKCIDGLFESGLSKVSYIRLIDADISALEIKDTYFTVMFSGYSEGELEARKVGSFNGVVVFETTDVNKGIEAFTDTPYSLTKDGYTMGCTYGAPLSSATWSNCQYRATNKEVSFVSDLGTSKTLYDNKITHWGKDETAGLRLLAFYIGGESFTKPYIEQEIAINLQTNNINLLAQELDYTLQDCAVVTNANSSYITKFYLETGLIKAFDYTVTLGTNNEMKSKLDITPTVAVWVINMEIGRKL